MLLFLFLLQVAVWYGIYSRALWLTEPEEGRGGSPPLSVIVAARNEAKNLERFLPEVLEQEYPDFEVLVVNDASSDDTGEVLKTLASRYTHLKVLEVTEKRHPGKKQALALGIEHARHERLVFTDADCRPASRRWLRLIAAAWGPGIDLVLGHAPFFPESGLFNRWVRFEADMAAITAFSLAQTGFPYTGVGRNLAWRKTLFDASGYAEHHRDLPGGDDDLLVNAFARAGNTAVVLHPGAFVYSPAREHWRAWLQQKRRHLSTGARYKAHHQAILAGLSLSRALFHLFCAVCLLFGPKLPALACLFGRWVLIRPVYRALHRRLHAPEPPQASSLFFFPVFDLLLSVYEAFWVSWSLWKPARHW